MGSSLDFQFVSPNNNGDYFESFADAREAAERLSPGWPQLHMWTVVESDEGDDLWASEGVRIVNSMDMWLVSKRPHNFGGHDFLWFEGGE